MGPNNRFIHIEHSSLNTKKIANINVLKEISDNIHRNHSKNPNYSKIIKSAKSIFNSYLDKFGAEFSLDIHNTSKYRTFSLIVSILSRTNVEHFDAIKREFDKILTIFKAHNTELSMDVLRLLSRYFEYTPKEFRKTELISQFFIEANIVLKEDIYEIYNHLEYLLRISKNRLDLLTRNGRFVRLLMLFKRNFPDERILEFVESSASNSKVNRFKEFFKGKADRTRLYFKGGIIVRNIREDSYRIWKELYDSKLSVEPIVGVTTDENLIKSIKPDFDEVLVVSKSVGISLDKLDFKSIPRDIKINIYRQIREIMLDIWKRGYAHNHPHLGNWTLRYERGLPIVTLIDLDLISKMNYYKEILYDRTQLKWIKEDLLREYD